MSSYSAEIFYFSITKLDAYARNNWVVAQKMCKAKLINILGYKQHSQYC
ncbi:hypothetical protein HMPREF3208_00010 [Gardnerella vaginalis]|uniref:Uncharacterized protein n=1 Tax=Gardnerella vaginalis TaxID=2702 RepID=A0A133P3A8_GARVA|nr:hypothetical protein HMPREF3208_00010 [Gardnerella vaginalis]